MADKKDKITFIDLFCGVGGIRLGMEFAGFECVMSSDINEECRRTYEANFHEWPLGDITTISAKEIPDHDVLCAGFPCQPFSISGKKLGFEDTRGTLFFEVCRIVKEKNPSVVLLENVKHLVHHDSGHTFAVIQAALSELGYNVSWRILNAVDFGVPQNRERIIIVATKNGFFDFDQVKTKKRKTIESILDKTGRFEYLSPDEYTLIPNPVKQQASGLIFVGYRNKTLRKRGVKPGQENLSRSHKQPNRIYSVEGTHPTLPSQESSGRFFVYTKDNRVRKLTIDECWRLMGFPKRFKRVSSVSDQYKQLGNSVCVPMFESLAIAINTQCFGNEVI